MCLRVCDCVCVCRLCVCQCVHMTSCDLPPLQVGGGGRREGPLRLTASELLESPQKRERERERETKGLIYKTSWPIRSGHLLQFSFEMKFLATIHILKINIFNSIIIIAKSFAIDMKMNVNLWRSYLTLRWRNRYWGGGGVRGKISARQKTEDSVFPHHWPP